MIIVGISGAISSGKSTLAETLTSFDPKHSLHLETSTIIVELADSFNRAILAQHANIQNDAIGTTNNILQLLLAELSLVAGQELLLTDITIQPADVSAHPEWYEKLFDYYKSLALHPELAKQSIIKENKSAYRALLQWIGGYFLYRLDDQLMWYKELRRRIASSPQDVQFAALTAPRQPAEAEYVRSIGGKVIVIERPELVSDRRDVTERRVLEIIPDIRVANDGTLEQLKACAQVLHADLLKHKLQPAYRASDYAVAAS